MKTIPTPTILANTDITDSFRLRCYANQYWEDETMKPSKLFTHKLIIDLNDMSIKALIQVNQDCKQMIFLN